MSDTSKMALEMLGERLRVFRIEREETQKQFAARLGVSVPSYQKLEAGDPSSKIGLWVDAIKLLDRLPDLDFVLAEKRSLFEQYEQEQKMTQKRRRVSRKRPSDA